MEMTLPLLRCLMVIGGGSWCMGGVRLGDTMGAFKPPWGHSLHHSGTTVLNFLTALDLFVFLGAFCKLFWAVGQLKTRGALSSREPHCSAARLRVVPGCQILWDSDSPGFFRRDVPRQQQ